MDEYKIPYLRLFNRISDIIKELELAQQEAEEIYLALAEKTEQAKQPNADAYPPFG